MTLFYDPKSKKTRPWVIALFVIVPIIVITIIVILAKSLGDLTKPEAEVQEVDIFETIQ